VDYTVPRPLNVYLLPALAKPEDLAGGVVVVIDVLRATTTITFALASGAKQVIPCLEIVDAQAAEASSPLESCVLGGEREGVRIAGFHLGNSPGEYTPQTVGGKTLVFTTTNGTKAMMRCRLAQRVLLGSFVSFLAVARELSITSEPIHLLCAGTAGEITREDAALAGALVYLLRFAAPREFELNDQAALMEPVGEKLLAEALVKEDHVLAVNNVRDVLRHSQGGRNLLALGLEQDIDEAAAIDRFDFVPRLDPKAWAIVQM
jgi:2-phosphosulfolactate phosphatase